MNLVHITDKLVTHQDEHAMGIAAYMVTMVLVDYLDKDAKNTVLGILIEQCEQQADGYREQGDKNKQELWTAAASHIKALLF